jgi:hypothetical protein
MKGFKAAVFGKQGCDKCDVLKRRLGKILQEETYAGFEMEYFDMGTIEGLIRFSQCEVLNPQRIPCLFVYRQVENKNGAELRPVRCMKKVSTLNEEEAEIDTFLSLETDYRSSGVITPAAIKEVLDQALSLQTAGV